MSFRIALFIAIDEDDEMAIALIDNCQRLTLSLSKVMESSEMTPLIYACLLKRQWIVKAILRQSKAKDIAINAKDKDGRTAFIWACYQGLTAVVAMMLEMAQEVKIDLNAKDDIFKMTGFICACEKKHSEVINLIMAKAESLQIDLHWKDEDGKSGFDHYPEHFQK